MDNIAKFYIDGAWRAAQGTDTHDLVNPADESVIARIPMADARDVDDAVAAAAPPLTIGN